MITDAMRSDPVREAQLFTGKQNNLTDEILACPFVSGTFMWAQSVEWKQGKKDDGSAALFFIKRTTVLL